MSEETNTPPAKQKEEPTASAAPSDKGTSKRDDTSSTDSRDNRSRGRKPRRGSRKKEPKEFEETILGIDRVTRVTAGGRQMRFRVSVAIGDKKGRVGFGIGKSSEVMVGVQKAIAQAKKRMINVPIVNDTIPHPVTMKYKATKLFLLPAPEGKGIIAGGAVRKILDLAGIKNVLSKLHGSRNKVTTAYATIKALESLRNEIPPGAKTPEVPAEETNKKEALPEKEEKKSTTKAKDTKKEDK